MSYRLINANAIAIKYPEVNDMPCVFANLQSGLHGQFIEEREKGKWTDDSACPFCGFQPWYEHDIHTLSFCPHCGADMRGGQDG